MPAEPSTPTSHAHQTMTTPCPGGQKPWPLVPARRAVWEDDYKVSLDLFWQKRESRCGWPQITQLYSIVVSGKPGRVRPCVLWAPCVLMAGEKRGRENSSSVRRWNLCHGATYFKLQSVCTLPELCTWSTDWSHEICLAQHWAASLWGTFLHVLSHSCS